MNIQNKFKKLCTFVIRNYFILIFLGCIAFVGLVSSYKLFVSKPTYVYVKVKVGQGMWWASTQRPSYWLINALKNIDQEFDVAGNVTSNIIDLRYYAYPWGSYTSNNSFNNDYNVFITAKLKVARIGKNKYNYNRSTIGIASPIDFEFPNVQFSGTIVEMSEKPLQDIYLDKIVYLTKTSTNQWEYDQIKIGDQYFDGQENIFEILDKNNQSTINNSNLITIRAKIKVKKIGDQLLFTEEQAIIPGKGIFVVTNNLFYDGYTIIKVE